MTVSRLSIWAILPRKPGRLRRCTHGPTFLNQIPQATPRKLLRTSSQTPSWTVKRSLRGHLFISNFERRVETWELISENDDQSRWDGVRVKGGSWADASARVIPIGQRLLWATVGAEVNGWVEIRIDCAACSASAKLAICFVVSCASIDHMRRATLKYCWQWDGSQIESESVCASTDPKIVWIRLCLIFRWIG